MLAPVVNSLPRGPLSSKREEEREREPSRGFLYIVRFLLRFVSFWIPFPPITEDESNLGRATLSMLFLSNPGSMDVFLLSNRFLPRGRFSNNNIPPFPFLFALSFPVFFFISFFFFRDERFYRSKQCQYRSISSKLYRALSILFIFLRDIGSPIPRNFHANICIPS